jgi:hypothetical protein
MFECTALFERKTIHVQSHQDREPSLSLSLNLGSTLAVSQNPLNPITIT